MLTPRHSIFIRGDEPWLMTLCVKTQNRGWSAERNDLRTVAAQYGSGSGSDRMLPLSATRALDLLISTSMTPRLSANIRSLPLPVL